MHTVVILASSRCTALILILSFQNLIDPSVVLTLLTLKIS